MVSNIRILFDNGGKANQGRFVVFILVIKLTHVKFMAGKALIAGQHITAGHTGIDIVGVLLNQAAVCFKRLVGIGLVPVDGIDLVEVRSGNAINYIRNSLVSRMKLLKFLVSKDGIRISLQIEMRIGDFKFRQDGIFGKRVPIP